MNKIVTMMLILMLFCFCSIKKQPTEPDILTLVEKFTFDTEKDDLAIKGVYDFTSFDLDSEGNIYLWCQTGREYLIFTFDENGNFVNSLGRMGKGPGEVEFISNLTVIHQDEIAVTDYGNKKFIVFGKNGELLKEMRIEANIWAVIPLENNNYIIMRKLADLEGEYIFQFPLSLCDSEFNEIRELDRQKIPNFIKKKRLKAKPYIFSWSLAKGKLHVANEDRGYEIWIFDLSGNLLRKIKKEYRNVSAEEYLKDFGKGESKADPQSEKIAIPKKMPPIQSFFTDDEGRIFVITYERGKNAGEYMTDIFSSDGELIGRKSLYIIKATMPASPAYAYIKAQKNELFCLREKRRGYKELAVYKMVWR